MDRTCKDLNFVIARQTELDEILSEERNRSFVREHPIVSKLMYELLDELDRSDLEHAKFKASYWSTWNGYVNAFELFCDHAGTFDVLDAWIGSSQIVNELVHNPIRLENGVQLLTLLFQTCDESDLSEAVSLIQKQENLSVSSKIETLIGVLTCNDSEGYIFQVRSMDTQVKDTSGPMIYTAGQSDLGIENKREIKFSCTALSWINRGHSWLIKSNSHEDKEKCFQAALDCFVEGLGCSFLRSEEGLKEPRDLSKNKDFVEFVINPTNDNEKAFMLLAYIARSSNEEITLLKAKLDDTQFKEKYFMLGILFQTIDEITQRTGEKFGKQFPCPLKKIPDMRRFGETTTVQGLQDIANECNLTLSKDEIQKMLSHLMNIDTQGILWAKQSPWVVYRGSSSIELIEEYDSHYVSFCPHVGLRYGLDGGENYGSIVHDPTKDLTIFTEIDFLAPTIMYGEIDDSVEYSFAAFDPIEKSRQRTRSHIIGITNKFELLDILKRQHAEQSAISKIESLLLDLKKNKSQDAVRTTFKEIAEELQKQNFSEEYIKSMGLQIIESQCLRYCEEQITYRRLCNNSFVKKLREKFQMQEAANRGENPYLKSNELRAFDKLKGNIKDRYQAKIDAYKSSVKTEFSNPPVTRLNYYNAVIKLWIQCEGDPGAFKIGLQSL